MFRRLKQWSLTKTKYKNGGPSLTPYNASLGAKVRMITGGIFIDQVGTIVDREHTKSPVIQFGTTTPCFVDIEQLQLWDDTNITLRPKEGVAIQTLVDGVNYIQNRWILSPKFFIVSPLTLRHLKSEQLIPRIKHSSTPLQMYIGTTTIHTNLLVDSTPVIDYIPEYYKFNGEIPHFLVGVADREGINFISGIILNLNSVQVRKPPTYTKGRKFGSLDIDTQSEFSKQVIKRKKHASWNF